MFPCKSCGAPLRFDPASQMMLCSYCDSQFDPYTIKQNGNASESKDLEMTVFVCKACGGELTATEGSAAEFCSFCGSPTILESRLTKLDSPKFIIPFSKTREESASLLKNHLKRSFFVPRGFKNSQTEKIRGIYMPSWSYNVSQKNTAAMKVERESGKDAYDIYEVTANVDSFYHGIPHDASESFADRISESLEPFDYKNRKPFTPGFIAGFFSDMKDVKKDKYEKYAVDMANEETFRQFVKRVPTYNGRILDQETVNKTKLFDTKVQSVDSMLIPVWFLSYKHGDRMAYAAVNGENGKVMSDLPISIGKILLLALAVSLPIFAILNLFFSMRAQTLVMISEMLMIFAALLFSFFLKKIREREGNVNFEHAKRKASKPAKKKNKKKGRFWSDFSDFGCAFLFMSPFIFGAVMIVFLIAGIIAKVLTFVIAIASVIIPIVGLKKYKKKETHTAIYGFVLLLIAGIFASGVSIVDPVSDVWFYSAAIGALMAILVTLVSVLRALNVLTTRPLPQFKKRGGEEYEEA